jgi:PHD/YefM family antitoxin component YafN of YafNO toxin-antitoxin module
MYKPNPFSRGAPMTQSDVDIVNYSEMRRKLASHLAQCNKLGKRFKIIRNGKAEGILISNDEWDQICETLAIVTNPKLMKQIVQSENDIKRKRIHKLNDVFKELLGEG